MHATRVGEYLAFERLLAKELAGGVGKEDAGDESTWQATTEAWQHMYDAVNTLSSTEDTAVVKQTALEKIGAVRDAWIALGAAHGAKKQADFETAKTAPAKAYEGLPAITEAGDTALQPLLEQFDSTYKAL